MLPNSGIEKKSMEISLIFRYVQQRKLAYILGRALHDLQRSGADPVRVCGLVRLDVEVVSLPAVHHQRVCLLR